MIDLPMSAWLRPKTVQMIQLPTFICHASPKGQPSRKPFAAQLRPCGDAAPPFEAQLHPSALTTCALESSDSLLPGTPSGEAPVNTGFFKVRAGTWRIQAREGESSQPAHGSGCPCPSNT